MSFKRKKILIIDDEEVIAKSIKFKLEKNYDTVVCSNGKEALETLNKHSIDLIVSDIMMPYMDGPSTLRAIRKSHTLKVDAPSPSSGRARSSNRWRFARAARNVRSVASSAA